MRAIAFSCIGQRNALHIESRPYNRLQTPIASSISLSWKLHRKKGEEMGAKTEPRSSLSRQVSRCICALHSRTIPCCEKTEFAQTRCLADQNPNKHIPAIPRICVGGHQLIEELKRQYSLRPLNLYS